MAKNSSLALNCFKSNMLTAFLKGWVMSGYEMLTALNCLLFKKPIRFGRLFVVIDFLSTVCTDIWNASTASNQSWYQQCFGKSYLSKGQEISEWIYEVRLSGFLPCVVKHTKSWQFFVHILGERMAS